MEHLFPLLHGDLSGFDADQSYPFNIDDDGPSLNAVPPVAVHTEFIKMNQKTRRILRI